MPYFVFTKYLFEGEFENILQAQDVFMASTGLDPCSPEIGTCSYPDNITTLICELPKWAWFLREEE